MVVMKSELTVLQFIWSQSNFIFQGLELELPEKEQLRNSVFSPPPLFNLLPRQALQGQLKEGVKGCNVPPGILALPSLWLCPPLKLCPLLRLFAPLWDVLPPSPETIHFFIIFLRSSKFVILFSICYSDSRIHVFLKIVLLTKGFRQGGRQPSPG